MFCFTFDPSERICVFLGRNTNETAVDSKLYFLFTNCLRHRGSMKVIINPSLTGPAPDSDAKLFRIGARGNQPA